MGISFGLLEQLRSRGLLEKGNRILDIGSSNLYSAQPDQVLNFISHYPQTRTVAESRTFADRLAKGSAYDAETGGSNKAFAGELLEYCGIDYLSFDIAAGYKTEIFDLNRQRLPDKYRGAFDVVINCGTTEHVLNQYNSFAVIHDAARVGGYIIHQLPVAGFTDHAYFVYTGRFFFDLAGYNGYEIADLWYDGPTDKDDLLASARSYKTYFPKLAALADKDPIDIPNCGITIIYRKTQSAPFNACLETSTSVGDVPSDVRRSYHAGGEAAATEPNGQSIAGGSIAGAPGEGTATGSRDARQSWPMNFLRWTKRTVLGLRSAASRNVMRDRCCRGDLPKPRIKEP